MVTTREIYNDVNPRIFSNEDVAVVNQAEKTLGEAGWDVFSAQAQHLVGNLLKEYYNANRAETVSLAGIYKVFEQNKSKIKTISPALRDWYKARILNPVLVDAVTSWIKTCGGKPDTLVNVGEEGLVNILQIVNAHTDHPLDAASFERTAIQQTNRPSSRLKWVPLPKPVDARQKTEDIKHERAGFSPLDYRRQARAREEAEIAKAKEKETGATQKNEDFYEFTIRRQLMYGGTHAEKDSLQRIHDRLEKAGASKWDIFNALEAEIKFLSQRSAVRNRGLR